MSTPSPADVLSRHAFDQQLLVYFVAVAEELNFSRAAVRCHVSQPALSKQIKRLERLIEVRLFDRSSRAVSMTEAGQRLLTPARDVLAAGQRFTESASQERRRSRRSLKVAFVAQAANEYTTAILREFAHRYPDATVQLQQLGPGHVRPALLDGRVDIAIVRLPIDAEGLAVTPLFSEPRVAVLPADHRLAGHASASIDDLLDEPWILNAAPDDRFQAFARADAHRAGHPLVVGATISSVDEYLEAVLAHQGIGLAPASATRYYARSGVVYLPVPDAEPSVAALAWPDEAGHPRPLAQAFADIVLELIPAH